MHTPKPKIFQEKERPMQRWVTKSPCDPRRGRRHKRGNRARRSGIVQGAWGKIPKTVYVLVNGNQNLKDAKMVNTGCRKATEDKFGRKKKNLKDKRIRLSRKGQKGVKAGNRLTDLISCGISGP